MKLTLMRTHSGDPGHWAIWSQRTGALYLCHITKPWFWLDLIHGNKRYNRKKVDIQRIIDMLKGREDGMREHIKKSAAMGDNESRVHYIGWLRGIEGSRHLLEYFRDHDET